MKSLAFGLIALAICLMMVAPMAMAIPGKPGGGNEGANYSTLTPDDFSSGPSQGRWRDGNTRWFVMFAYAINQLPPGQPIDITNVPSSVSGTNEIHHSMHGEELYMPVSTKSLTIGRHYHSPGDISAIGLDITCYGYGATGRVNLHIILDTGAFVQGEWVNIDVTKTQIHFYSEVPLPFVYKDWHIAPAPILGTNHQAFDITIDK